MADTEIAKKETSIAMTKTGMQLRSMDEAWRFAVAVGRSGLAPRQFDTTEKIVVAIQHGAEVGLSPIQSLQSICVINGRPSLYGDALPALAWGSGVLEELHEEIEGTGDSRVAVCTTRRKGQERPCVTRFSVADAKQAKLWGKAGPWKDYPQRMLQMRARSWNFRDNLADVLKGLHVAEEVADFAPARVEHVEETVAIDLDELNDDGTDVIDAEVEEPVSEEPEQSGPPEMSEAEIQFIRFEQSIEAAKGEKLMDLQAEIKIAAMPESDRKELLKQISDKMAQ